MIRTQYTPGAPGASIIAWKVDTFADLALLRPTADDEGRAAQALDTRALYVLLNSNPVSWLSLGTGSVTPPAPSSSPDSVWTPLSVMAVENPMNHGATGNGTTDDTTALANTIAALPAAGGIVYLPAGKVFKKTNRIVITKAHCKLWAPNGQAEIYAVTGNAGDKQSLKSAQAGFGVFGVRFRSDATARGGTLDDHMVVADAGCSLFEAVGVEINGSRAVGLFSFGAHDIYEEGCYIHHTWADHIHHTNGAYNIWVWQDWINNNNTSLGDDVVAFVTYGDDDSGNCHDAEVWEVTSIYTGWGRGIAAMGVTNLNSHNNRIWGVAGAGLIIASESGGSHTTPSHNVTSTNDEFSQCGHAIGHAGILISGDNGTITNVTLLNDKSANNGGGGDYHTEGSFSGVTNTGLDTNAAHLGPQPTVADVVIKDTSVLKTRDTSHVPSGQRPGLLRIHVRPVGSPSAPSGFEQRFEYVVKGTPTDVTAWVATRTAAGDYLSEQRTVSGTAYALLLCAAPVTLGTGITAVTHTDLRAGDNNGTLSWLWDRVDQGDYA